MPTNGSFASNDHTHLGRAAARLGSACIAPPPYLCWHHREPRRMQKPLGAHLQILGAHFDTSKPVRSYDRSYFILSSKPAEYLAVFIYQDLMYRPC